MKPPPAHAFVNRLIGLTLVLLIFSGSLGLGAVWMRQEISQAANRGRLLEVKMADVERRLDEVNAQVAAAVNPDALLRQNQVMRLGLLSPREIQVVRVGESPELRLAAKHNREVFSVATASISDEANPPAFHVLTTALR
ncbi:MAG TPA: hypothetical protein VG936_00725 [Lacunisphaera sp.]|nr:hypothetical protein [Lacunisphaera sp.]